ncbi:hypothetical protein BaRGS_00000666 [Batillaria attramentaria]|uniref:CARD domain-containing protein n=1 Tax=Batillaria attramentaria TaxID=370345 RepID=A0ABD0M9J8_9CAEN
MASTLRRNTFVLDGPTGPSLPAHVSGMDRQNLMRLKVNRIALVQELHVEHILGHLTKVGIITEPDLRKIEMGRTPQDRARILIDLLPTKSKDLDWYKSFRDALLNPDGSNNVKQRYKSLVEFLDNTMIHRPTSQAGKFSEVESRSKRYPRYPRYEPLPQISEKKTGPNVLNLEEEWGQGLRQPSSSTQYFDVDKMSSVSGDSQKPMMLVKGFFHQWIPTPDNFRSLLELPKTLRQELEEAGTPEAEEQLRKEQEALQYLRRLEVISALARRRQLPPGFELCMCDAVQDLLSQPHLYHLYLKHLRTLQDSEVYLMKDICASYASILEMLAVDLSSSLHRQVVGMGFRLADLLVVVEMWPQAEETLLAIINFLGSHTGLETWVDEYKAQVRLMGVRNDSCDLSAAQRSYFSAAQLTYQIQLVSFGQRLLYEGRLHQELSTMLLEYGSINSAHGWSRKALQEVDPEDHEAVIEVVTQAVMTHCACWQAKKAETLAVFAVQLAFEKFGKHHPLYLKALSSLCQFCNEFKQDGTGVQLAKELLDAAEKTYGCESLTLAAAHRTLSKALMVKQAFRTDDGYYTHAMEAVRIARSQLPHGHPMLHPYLTNFAMALQWKSLHCPKEVQDSTLRWAETEAQQALTIVIKHYGDISLRSAQIHTLLGQIYSKMNQ